MHEATPDTGVELLLDPPRSRWVAYFPYGGTDFPDSLQSKLPSDIKGLPRGSYAVFFEETAGGKVTSQTRSLYLPQKNHYLVQTEILTFTGEIPQREVFSESAGKSPFSSDFHIYAGEPLADCQETFGVTGFAVRRRMRELRQYLPRDTDFYLVGRAMTLAQSQNAFKWVREGKTALSITNDEVRQYLSGLGVYELTRDFEEPGQVNFFNLVEAFATLRRTQFTNYDVEYFLMARTASLINSLERQVENPAPQE